MRTSRDREACRSAGAVHSAGSPVFLCTPSSTRGTKTHRQFPCCTGTKVQILTQQQRGPATSRQSAHVTHRHTDSIFFCTSKASKLTRGKQQQRVWTYYKPSIRRGTRDTQTHRHAARGGTRDTQTHRHAAFALREPHV